VYIETLSHELVSLKLAYAHGHQISSTIKYTCTHKAPPTCALPKKQQLESLVRDITSGGVWWQLEPFEIRPFVARLLLHPIPTTHHLLEQADSRRPSPDHTCFQLKALLDVSLEDYRHAFLQHASVGAA
jgi:hypothetical protein